LIWRYAHSSKGIHEGEPEYERPDRSAIRPFCFPGRPHRRTAAIVARARPV
jgi:hypothetical protein